jgi:hypothetical protein
MKHLMMVIVILVALSSCIIDEKGYFTFPKKVIFDPTQIVTQNAAICYNIVITENNYSKPEYIFISASKILFINNACDTPFNALMRYDPIINKFLVSNISPYLPSIEVDMEKK